MFVYGGYLLGVILSLVIVFITYFKWTYQYWRRKNVPYLEPSIPFGNMKSTAGKEYIGSTIKRLYKEMQNKGWRYGGIYALATPTLLVLDLDLIKTILTKDFQYFTDRGSYSNEEKDPLTGHLAFLEGDRWKSLRSKLSPTFTSGKMKMMFQTLIDCEANLHRKIDEECASNKPIDIKEVLACFTTDVIGSCAFGLDCSATEKEDSPFRYYGRKATQRNRWVSIKTNLASHFPKIAKFINVTITATDVSSFFINVVKDTVSYREKENIKRNDFMQLLIDLKSKTSKDGGLTINQIAAQSFVFFLGGFETSSTLMSFALLELSQNQTVQQKLRDEINTVLKKHDGQLTYDSVMDMKYLNQVIDETLRLHPPVALTGRKCTKTYRLPGENFTIEKGDRVMIPIIGIHHDETYYPNPSKFDPDRFSYEKKQSRHQYTLLPFGEGPRNCIGMRFGVMQAKLGLSSLLKRYKFTLNEKTAKPISFVPTSLILSVAGDIWLNVEKI